MKKIFFIFTLLLGTWSFAQYLNYCDPFSNEMYFQDGRTRINKENLQKYFQEILTKQGNSVSQLNFELQHAQDAKSKVEYIMLVGIFPAGNLKIAQKLAPNNGGIYVLAGVTVTCKGCTRGCSPKQFGGSWECSDCSFGSSNGCEKTETINTP